MCDGAIMYFSHGINSSAERFCMLPVNMLLKLYYCKIIKIRRYISFLHFLLNADRVVPHTMCNVASFSSWEKGENRIVLESGHFIGVPPESLW